MDGRLVRAEGERSGRARERRRLQCGVAWAWASSNNNDTMLSAHANRKLCKARTTYRVASTLLRLITCQRPVAGIPRCLGHIHTSASRCSDPDHSQPEPACQPDYQPAWSTTPRLSLSVASTVTRFLFLYSGSLARCLFSSSSPIARVLDVDLDRDQTAPPSSSPPAPDELRLRHRPRIARSAQTRHPSSHLSPLLSVAQR
ncbi:hypothetical protein IWX90DRAFT_76634 [Phyllosticta citrichinensis]|uniref:Uncharacterized protein n=1 Tax=Phyllosticta citrichinensis TaxID=1130410 RepID=A0ABR1XGJ4_9PEZI